MDTSSTHVVEETSYMRSGEEDEEEDEGGDEEDGEADGDEEDKKEEKVELAVQKQQSSPWAPWFFCRATKEVHYYVGQEIVITEGLDSYAGMIWPGALALCHYLDTHREQLSLVDKAVLEIGAGTGLVSIVAAFLGGWVTATDLPVVLNNLRVNLSRNTRGLCRHTPQVAALTWGYDLESTYPTSVYRYDYVLAADVVYCHDFLEELLFTMKHFCKPGTTLIWANKVRFESDLTFMENFKKAFHTNLLVEDGEMKIFMATCREEEGEGDVGLEDLLREEEEGKTEEAEAEDEDGDVDEDDDDDDGEKSKEALVEEQFVDEGKIKGNKNDNDVTGEPHMSEPERGDDKEETNKHESDEEMEEVMVLKDDDCKEDEKDKPDDSSSSTTPSKAEVTGQAYINQPAMPQGRTPGCISMSIGGGSVLLSGQQQGDGEPAGKGGAGAGSRNRTGNHCGQSAGSFSHSYRLTRGVG
ncbi:protein-lysine methyltransferase METTL21C isoform X2 [Micropterus salmoides]|uniref:protein-lysine methyltransferase METTL21C isoform X2 n=1 Tax=Micropterus salmoides TaxID=27706 RepID=UPI0018EACE09|nr:protein-lysine methyltransferase METTL21C isoform X2 [Micropterus salmoides]